MEKMSNTDPSDSRQKTHFIETAYLLFGKRFFQQFVNTIYIIFILAGL